MNRLLFKGKGLEFFKFFFVDVLLAGVSLSLLLPRAWVRAFRYFSSHTTLDGEAFQCNAPIKPFFNGYMRSLLAFLLAIIVDAVLIYVLVGPAHLPSNFAFWIAYPLILVWSFLLIGLTIHGDLTFAARHLRWRDVRVSYTGMPKELIDIYLPGNLLCLFTLGLYYPFMEVRLNQFLCRNLRFGSLRFDYTGTNKELFRLYLRGYLLSIVTLGIYGIWFCKDWYAYTIGHIQVRKGEQSFHLESNANTLEVFETMVGNVLICLCTLGIGSAWVFTRQYRFIVEHCVIPAEFMLEGIEAEKADTEPQPQPSHWLDRWNPLLMG
jgi:uncharacterized membrane protein YjgN (DUF898 family)